MSDNSLESITGVPGYHTSKSNDNHTVLSRRELWESAPWIFMLGCCTKYLIVFPHIVVNWPPKAMLTILSLHPLFHCPSLSLSTNAEPVYSLKTERQHQQSRQLAAVPLWLQVSRLPSTQNTGEWQNIQQIFIWTSEKLRFIHSLTRAKEHTTAAERRDHSLGLWEMENVGV